MGLLGRRFVSAHGSASPRRVARPLPRLGAGHPLGPHARKGDHRPATSQGWRTPRLQTQLELSLPPSRTAGIGSRSLGCMRLGLPTAAPTAAAAEVVGSHACSGQNHARCVGHIGGLPHSRTHMLVMRCCTTAASTTLATVGTGALGGAPQGTLLLIPSSHTSLLLSIPEQNKINIPAARPFCFSILAAMHLQCAGAQWTPLGRVARRGEGRRGIASGHGGRGLRRARLDAQGVRPRAQICTLSPSLYRGGGGASGLAAGYGCISSEALGVAGRSDALRL